MTDLQACAKEHVTLYAPLEAATSGTVKEKATTPVEQAATAAVEERATTTVPGRSESKRQPLPMAEPKVEALRERMASEAGKALYKKRKETIEREFADLEEHRGMTRFTGYGPSRAETQVGKGKGGPDKSLSCSPSPLGKGVGGWGRPYTDLTHTL